MPPARWEKQNKTGRFNIRTFYSGVLSTFFPPGCSPFLSPLVSLTQGSEVSGEIREVRRDQTIWLYAVVISPPCLRSVRGRLSSPSAEIFPNWVWWNRSTSLACTQRQTSAASTAYSSTIALFFFNTLFWQLQVHINGLNNLRQGANFCIMKAAVCLGIIHHSVTSATVTRSKKKLKTL